MVSLCFFSSARRHARRRAIGSNLSLPDRQSPWMGRRSHVSQRPAVCGCRRRTATGRCGIVFSDAVNENLTGSTSFSTDPDGTKRCQVCFSETNKETDWPTPYSGDCCPPFRLCISSRIRSRAVSWTSVATVTALSRTFVATCSALSNVSDA